MMSKMPKIGYEAIEKELFTELPHNSSTKKRTNLEQKFLDLATMQGRKEAEYGEQYKEFGKLALLLLGPIELKNVQDYNRFGAFVQILAKVGRYAFNWKNGHQDSLDDLSVYAQQLQALDDEMRSNPF